MPRSLEASDSPIHISYIYFSSYCMHMFEVSFYTLQKFNSRFVQRVSAALTEPNVDGFIYWKSISTASCSKDAQLSSIVKQKHKRSTIIVVPLSSPSGSEKEWHCDKKPAWYNRAWCLVTGISKANRLTVTLTHSFVRALIIRSDQQRVLPTCKM